jgi:putative spermidine/putrescine transport system substrate-binding protein
MALIALSGSLAVAQDSITMAVWGGGGAQTWREAFIRDFFPTSKVEVKIAEVPNPAGALRSPAAAQYNAALVTYFEAIALAKAGLIETFSADELPALSETDPRFVAKNAEGRLLGVPAYFTFYGIAINTDLAKPEDFASWQQLADPKWKGRIAVTRPLYLAPYDAVIMAKASGGDERRIEPGFALLRKMMPNVLTTYTSLAHMNTLLTRGEVAAVPFYASRVTSLRRHGAKNVAMVLPREGALALAYVVVVPKGARNRAASLKWMNYLSTAAPQSRAADLDGWLPVNKGASVPRTLEQDLGVTFADLLPRLYSPDWNEIVARNEERINEAERIVSGATR